MANTNFVDGVTPITAQWLNDVNTATYGNTMAGVTYTPAGTGAVPSTIQAKLRENVSVLDFGADPTGATDSTVAVQNFFNYICSQASGQSTRAGHFPTGVYKLSATINVVAGYFMPNVFTAGADAVYIKSSAAVVFYIKGGSGNFCHAEWQGMTIDGTANNGSNEGVRVDGLDWWQWKYLKLRNVYTGVRIYNLSGGNFNEGVLFPNLNANGDVTYAMRLSASDGQNSFRSCGMPGAAINIPVGGAALLIDAAAHPYFFNIDQMTSWPASSTIILNNSTQNGNSFIGNVTVETSVSTTLFSCPGGNIVYWSGGLLMQGGGIQVGQHVYRGTDIVAASNGSTSATGAQQSYAHAVTTPGEVVNLIGNTGSTLGYFLFVRLDAPNWYYQYTFIVCHQGYGAAQGYTQIANLFAYNASGWGPPVFSAAANQSYMTITNANWSTGTTLQWTTVPIGVLGTVV
jgi:hypothetical protein